MNRLLQIEWLKLRYNRIFAVIILVYFVLLILVPLSVDILFRFLESKGAEFQGIKPSMMPFYDFPDIWQNITYMTSFVKLVPAFLVIISVTNEYSYKTIRQNVIDGMSRTEFFLSKQALIVSLAFAQILIIFIMGMILGLAKSSVTDARFILQDIVFLPTHFLELVIYFNLAFMFSLLVKKAGYAIMVLILYNILIEPILYGVLYLGFETTEAQDYLPLGAVNNLIRVPYQRYVFMEIQDYVSLKDIIIATIWGGLITFYNYKVISKKDL